MIEFQSQKPELSMTLDGAVKVTFTAPKAKLNFLSELKENTYDVIVKQHRERRSLDANAYFHLLISKIADARGLGVDELKRSMVCEYGTVAFIARIPENGDLDAIYPYNKFIGVSKGTKEPCNDYYIFKPTHTLNTKEMAKLIDGVVVEAKELGIETKTPTELAEIKSLWR